MVCLYYQQKTKWKNQLLLQSKIKRKARTIPFGYKLAEDPDYIEPIESELEALEEVKKEQLSENSTNDQSQIQVTGTTYQGRSFKDLYRRCRRAFLVNSDLTLRAQLTEFRDHKLIRERKGVDDGIDYLVIPLNSATLAEFLEQRNNMNME